MYDSQALHVSRASIMLTAALLTATALFGQTAGSQGGAGSDQQRANVLPEIRVTPTLPKQSSTNSSVVTLQELSHTVPGKARTEMEKAEAARAKNRTDEAIDRLNRAISIDPDFVAARNNLAVLYLYSNQTEAAVAQLEEAVRIDPWNSTLFSNLTIGYVMSRRFEAAERTARVNMDLDRVGSHAPMLLGMVLVTERKYTAEALRYFNRARGDYPLAHLLAGLILLAQAKLAEAKPYFEAYLATGDQEHRSEAARWLARIDQGQQGALSGLLH